MKQCLFYGYAFSDLYSDFTDPNHPAAIVNNKIFLTHHITGEKFSKMPNIICWWPKGKNIPVYHFDSTKRVKNRKDPDP
jgi:hypothetical protein